MSQLDQKLQSRAMSALPEPRKPDFPEEDSLQFIWAVSYCDLLMVLMSFFILFFQVADPNSQSALQNVMLSLKGEASIKTAAVAEVKHHEAPVTNVLEKLSQALESEQVKIVRNPSGKSIVLDFDRDLYRPGAYAFPDEERSRLEKILSRIQPYSKDLLITFIGHADEQRITHGNRAIIDSNLVLSNLRATRAVEIAFKLGFDPKGVVGQGAGEFSRNTRSISIQITERASP